MRLLTSSSVLALIVLAAQSLPAPQPITAQSQIQPYDDPSRVLVLYSTTSTTDTNGNGMNDSEEIAMTYAVKRGVPRQNLLGLSLYHGWWPPPGYTGTVCDYFHEFTLGPVKAKLQELGPTAIDYILLAPDTGGSPSQTATLENILAIPFGINHSCTVCQGGTAARPAASLANPYLETSPGKPIDQGHFSHPANKVTIPTGNTCMNPGTHDMYLVARLGYRSNNVFQPIDAVRNQILGALYAEKYYAKEPGYYHGTNYVDVRFYNPAVSPYNEDFSKYASYHLNSDFHCYWNGSSADKCIFQQVKFHKDLGLPYKFEKTGNIIGQAAAVFNDGTSGSLAKEAMFYGGWYSFGTYGEGYDWLPGSAGIDVNSDSCDSFGGGGMAAGLTASVCAAFEPYLNGHARPEVFTYYLTHGFNFAESAWASIPYHHWANVVIGDPLYRPLREKTLVKDTSFAKDLITVDGTHHCTEGVWGSCTNEPATNCSTTHTIRAFIEEGAEAELADFKLDYGTTPALGSSVPYYNKGNYRFFRAFLLENLTPNTHYYYSVTARDPLGNTKTTAVKDFMTCQTSAEGFIVQAAASKKTITAGETVNFDVTSACPDCTYTWHLGEDEALTGKTQRKRFDVPGSYDIFVTAEKNGRRAMDRRIIFVLPSGFVPPPTAECTEGATMPCGATDAGECALGTQTCTAGTWGACVGEVPPVAEVCDAKDNNCNGLTDEQLLCEASPSPTPSSSTVPSPTATPVPIPAPTISPTPLPNTAPIITVEATYHVRVGELLTFPIIISDRDEGEIVTLRIDNMTQFPDATLE